MGETILVTGSSNGIGEAIAKVFADNNYDIIIHGRNKQDLVRVYKDISNKGVNCYSINGDLRDDKALNDLYDIAKKKDISILVNNAGALCPAVAFDKLDNKDLEDVIRVNFLVPIKLTKMIYPLFLDRSHGTIINMNSIIGLEVKTGKPVFSGARWGLRGFTESFRLEAKEKGIRVMSIYPTRVKTKPEFEYGMDPDETARKIYEAYKNNIEDLILDGRPEQYRPKK